MFKRHPRYSKSVVFKLCSTYDKVPKMVESDFNSNPDQIPKSKPSIPLTINATPFFSKRRMALFEVILCSGFPTQLFVALTLHSFGLTAIDQTGQLLLGYVVTLSLIDSVILVGLIIYFLHLHDERLTDVFLGNKPNRPEIALGIILVPFMVVFAIITLGTLHYFWPWLRNVPANPMEALIQSPIDAFVFILVGVIAGGLREEIQRAFVLHRFEQHLGGGWLGLCMFSVVFGLGHYVQGWDVSISTAILGGCWGAIYLLRKNVISPIVSHAGFNLTEILLAYFSTSAFIFYL